MYPNPFLLTFLLLISLPLLFLLLRPPLSLRDDLDDLSLFSRASSKKLSHLSHKTPHLKLKLAFLFLTNTPLHFSPLWNLFFHNTPSHLYNIYIHSHPNLNLTRPLTFTALFNSRLIPSKPTFRASPTLISATRRLLASALLHDPANSYFLLLSQYCIPLHSFPYTYNSLILSPTFDLTSSQSHNDNELSRLGLGVRSEYRSFIEIIDKESHLWERYIARGRFAMMPEVSFGQFRVGSQFFALTRKHAVVVVKDRDLWRKFKLPCYADCYPEEHYFPTLLSMVDPVGCTKYTLTNINWTGTVNGHPHMYYPHEVSEELILRLRESNQSESNLFARKFSPDTLPLLMQLAKSVIFKD